LADILFSMDMPLPSRNTTPSTSKPFCRRMFSIALLAPSNEASSPALTATSWARMSPSVLSEWSSMLSTSWASGADRISPSTFAFAGAFFSIAPAAPAPIRLANASTSLRPGSVVRGE
jgi:hypothetical protein